MGFPSLWNKFKLPVWLLMPLAYLCNVIGWLMGTKVFHYLHMHIFSCIHQKLQSKGSTDIFRFFFISSRICFLFVVALWSSTLISWTYEVLKKKIQYICHYWQLWRHYFSFSFFKFYFNLLQLKLNPFNVRVLVMHRWFNIKAAEKELDFQPIIPFHEVLSWDDNLWMFFQNFNTEYCFPNFNF